MTRRCTKCILPDSYPDSDLDRADVCALCRNYKKPQCVLGRDALIQVLRSIKKKGQYDCIVPLSGGKDSTYILYYAVRELQLKPIAVNYDSGFQSQVAKQNIQRTCKALNVPLVIKKSRLTKRILKVNFLLLQYGNGFNPCINCEVALRTISINVAKKYAAPYILWGSSALESVTYEQYQKYRQLGCNNDRQRPVLAELLLKIAKVDISPRKAFRTVLGVYHRICNKCQRLFLVLNVPVGYAFYGWMYRFLIVLQRLQMGVQVKYLFGVGTQVPFTKSPTFIHFFDYIKWDSIKNIKLLEDYLGWKHPEKVKDRFDCLLHCYANYNHLRAHSISQDGINFCNMIRERKATREEAFSKEIHIQNTVRKECEDVSGIIGISRAYLQEYWFR